MQESVNFARIQVLNDTGNPTKALSENPDFIGLLEQLRWDGEPICPYCEAKNAHPNKQERRYHCASCHRSFSVTVGTPMHKTRIDLAGWFKASRLVILQRNQTSIRHLADQLQINRNSAELLIRRINQAEGAQLELLKKMAEIVPEIVPKPTRQTPNLHSTKPKKTSPPNLPQNAETPKATTPGKVWVRY